MVAWANGKNVVVLGAGATRGAEFVGGNKSTCIPPLDADFFTQLQRVKATNRQRDIDAVIDDVVSSFGSNFHLTLEEYFTHIEALRRGGSLLPSRSSKKYSVAALNERRAHLLDALSAVLEESADVTRSASPAVMRPCGHHRAVVDALNPPDSIISFNYDCLIDDALRKSSRPVWSPKYGYGFPNPARIDPATARHWSIPGVTTTQNATIRLFKLHGSLNWRPLPDNDGDVIHFRAKTYKQNGQKRFEIIPPEFFKEIQREPFRTLWTRATSALRAVETLVLVGFSFPKTDQLVEAMFRMGLEDNKSLKRLVVVNPSATDRERIRRVCAEILSRRKCRVVEFDHLSDFAPNAKALLV